MTIDRGITPPQWAETLLRLLLRPQDRDSVSGDLLEEYRESIVPMRGSRQADVWYLWQVAGFVWQATWFWALVFSGAGIARTMYDWFVPTTHFAVRSAVSTWAGVGTLLFASAWGSWRSRSVGAGLVIAVVTGQIAALMSVAGAALLLAVWHDPDTAAGHRRQRRPRGSLRAPVLYDHPGGDCWLGGGSGRSPDRAALRTVEREHEERVTLTSS